MWPWSAISTLQGRRAEGEKFCQKAQLQDEGWPMGCWSLIRNCWAVSFYWVFQSIVVNANWACPYILGRLINRMKELGRGHMPHWGERKKEQLSRVWVWQRSWEMTSLNNDSIAPSFKHCPSQEYFHRQAFASGRCQQCAQLTQLTQLTFWAGKQQAPTTHCWLGNETWIYRLIQPFPGGYKKGK